MRLMQFQHQNFQTIGFKKITSLILYMNVSAKTLKYYPEKPWITIGHDKLGLSQKGFD